MIFQQPSAPLSNYTGSKNWNELSLAERKDLIEFEFGGKEGWTAECLTSTGLKKAQYQGLRALCIQAIFSLHEDMILDRHNLTRNDGFKILRHFEGSKFHDEAFNLFTDKAGEDSQYDGIELEKFAFRPGERDLLEECSDWGSKLSSLYITLNLLERSDDYFVDDTGEEPEEHTDLEEEFNARETTRFSLYAAKLPNLITRALRYPFCSKDFVLVSEEIRFFFRELAQSSDRTIRSEMLSYARGLKSHLSEQITTRHFSAKRAALQLIKGFLAKRLLSGHEHIYRGVLNANGRMLLDVYQKALQAEITLNYADSSNAEREAEWLLDSIKSAG